MASEWDLAVPPNTELVSDLPAEHRQMKTDTKAVMEKEHATLGTGNSGGEHKQGSARAFFQDTAPATQVDGTAFAAEDLGSLWIDSNASPDNQFNILTATTPTWTPISTEIIAVLLASNRQFAGNIIVDGTLTSTGVATLADASELATSGAPAADAQLANKKYVDDQWTPTAYTGGETTTLGNGLIMKFGDKLVAANTLVEVTYGTAFPTACLFSVASYKSTALDLDQNAASTPKSGSEDSILQIANGHGAELTITWIAIGH